MITEDQIGNEGNSSKDGEFQNKPEVPTNSSEGKANVKTQNGKRNPKKPQKAPFWKKHILELLLLLLLVVSITWGYFGKRQVIKDYETQITNLEETHQSNIREMRSAYIRDLSSTLALAIRSEMINENMNQVDQYMLQTVKLYDVERIMLVDNESGAIRLCTNKKDEGGIFDNDALVKTTKPIAKIFNGNMYTATPIMGLNSQMAVLIIQMD